MAMDSAKEEATHGQIDMDFQDNAQAIGYGLRENPKKSRKFSDLIPGSGPISSIQENKCKVCAKEFETPKALFGHMRHHSGRQKKRFHCEECEKTFVSLKSLANHSRIHSVKPRVSSQDMGVERLYVKRKRSGRKRCKFTSTSANKVSSFEDNNDSLSVSEIDHEVLQAALCLMMLSRAERKLDGFNPFSESSKDDSATPEDKSNKSLNLNKKSLTNENENECFEMKKPKRRKKGFPDRDSFNFLYEKKENNSADLNTGSGCNNEQKNGANEKEMISSEVKSSNALKEEVRLNQIAKKVIAEECSVEFGGASCNKEIQGISGSENLDDYEDKRVKNECYTCKRVFRSRKALGGHSRVHYTKMAENCEKKYENSIVHEEVEGSCADNSMEISKEFKCGICFKAFASGQALGGHKRTHLAKNSETRTEERIVVKQESSGTCDGFDLNIPIVVESDHDEAELKRWWLPGECSHEPMASLVVN